MEQHGGSDKFEWLYKDDFFSVSTCPYCEDYIVTIYTPSNLVDFLTICKVFHKLCDIFKCGIYFDFEPEFESNFFVFHVLKIEKPEDVISMDGIIKEYKEAIFKKYEVNNTCQE